MNPRDFIDKLAPIATEDMRRYGVPASLTLAQAILESNWGKSGLTQQANNLFGIKGTGPAGSVTMQTTEYRGQTPYRTNAQFRKYNNWQESVADHTKLILNGTKDKPNRYHGVLWADYKTAATEIWKGGYATDPNYPNKLIAVIEQHSLYQYDVPNPKEVERVNMEQLIAELKDARKQIQQLNTSLATVLKTTTEQEHTIRELNKRLKKLESLHPENIPVWAEPAVKAAQEAGILNDPAGSYDFYRMVTLMHRMGLIPK